MSGSQSFGIRLSLEGAEAVESGLRRVQATAQQSQSAIQQTGESAGRSLALIERGTTAASQGLTKLGGDFAALAPAVETAGGAVGRLVTVLGAGAGLAGVVGIAGAAVAAAVTLYQNWSSVTGAVSTAVDFLTGRVRLNAEAIATANERLRDYLRLSESAAQAGVRRQTEQQQGFVAGFQNDLSGIDRNIGELERALQRARGGTPLLPQSGLGAVRLRPDEQRDLEESFRQRGEARARDPAVQERVAQLEGDLRVARGERERVAAALRQAQGNVSALGEATGSVLNPPPAETPATTQRRGGGGGGGAARQVNDALRERDALVQRNLTADERYSQGLERIAALNDRLIAQGNDPLPDEVVQREATRLMDEYERATQRAADGAQNLADGTRELERAGAGAAKALAGAFEDLVFEGQNVDDVLKNLERSLLRLGNQYLVQPLFQQALGALFGGSGGGAGGGGAGGAIGSLLGSLFGRGGGGAAGAASIYASAAEVGPFLFHEGGTIGAGGRPGPMVPLSLFANAPRFHGGGIIGPDERPIIAQVGERMLNRQEAADYARGGGRGVTVNINGVRNPDEFRQSRSQVTASMARALARSGRHR